MKKCMHLVGLSHVECGGIDWWRELVNAVKNLRAHRSINCGEFLDLLVTGYVLKEDCSLQFLL